jgi:hypothetical protein
MRVDNTDIGFIERKRFRSLIAEREQHGNDFADSVTWYRLFVIGKIGVFRQSRYRYREYLKL